METKAVPEQAKGTPAQRRARRNRSLLLLGLVVGALGLLWSRWDTHRQIGELERSRLAVQVRAIEQNLARQLGGIHAALTGSRKDLAAWPEAERAARARSQFEALCEAVPGMVALRWVDAQGQVLAGNRPVGARTQAGDPYFEAVRGHPDPGVLFISEPFKLEPGMYTLNLSIAIDDSAGAFDGLLVATLDIDYVNSLLGSVLYARDMWASILSGGGSVLVTNPLRPEVLGANVARPGTAFTRHVQSGHPASVLIGRTIGSNVDDRLVALRTLRPANVPMDQPLVLAVSRELTTLYGGWSRVNMTIGVAYAAFALFSWLALVAQQRRREEDDARATAEAARSAAEGQRLALALHGGDLALWDAHVPSGVGTVNDRWYSMLGYQRAEISSDQASWQSLVHPDDRERVLAAHEAHLSGAAASYEEQYRLRHRDGHWVWVLDRGRVVERDARGAPLRMVGTHMDITERVESEDRRRRSDQAMLQTLRDTEARLRMASRLARLGDWRYDLASDEISFSPDVSLTPAGQAESFPTLEAGLEVIAPAHRRRFRDRLLQALADGLPFEEEVDVLPANGRDGPRRRLLVLGEVARDADGRVVALQGALQDVTEARRAQQQLRLLEAAVSGLNDMVVITEVPLHEPGPPIVFVNDAFERLTGWRREEVLGRSPRFLQGPDSDPQELARVDAALAAGHAVRSELVNYTRDGRPYWVDIALVPLLDESGQMTHVVSVHRDISERRLAESDRRALERQLREAQKIESIGTLAGGIAHDFNNILAAILGNVALARGDLPEDHRAQVSLEQIHKASLRARSLVQQILTFSRRQLNPLVAQKLRPIVEETLALLRATLPAAVRVDTALADEPLWVQADATQIQQVLMNLCTNAWHALPEGRGRIEIGCAALPPGAPEMAQEPTLALVPAVHLWVRDDGSGMDDETLERIFDPFYTTKPVGQGTGLGLSVVHGIVRNHSGVVRVESSPGHGSCFHLYFPASPPPGAASPIELALPEAGVGGGQQVLYVDDDEVMLLMVERLLQRAGYGVVVCQSAEAAWALVREQPERFDLVISDYNMPEASGIELARRLVALRPGLPIIISSGFVTEDLHAQAMALGVRALLHKEKTLEELPGLVQRVLAQLTATD